MGDRIVSYVGPSVQVTPDAIERYERQGCWLADEKRDGAWAEIKTDETGKIVSLLSRTGKTFAPDEEAGLKGLPTPLPNCTFASELEAKSHAGTVRYQTLGYRRAHLFDVIRLLGQDVTKLPIEKRRDLLTLAGTKFTDPAVAKRLPVVRQVDTDFQPFYQDVMSNGGEGLVFKRVGSVYRPHHSDGKVDYWVRCKQYRYVDYVVTGVGRSPSGQPNIQAGLYVKGTLKRVCTIKDPPPIDLSALVGLVIECKGAEVFPSGALRHGHFERIRDDKSPEECTLEAALAAGGQGETLS